MVCVNRLPGTPGVYFYRFLLENFAWKHKEVLPTQETHTVQVQRSRDRLLLLWISPMVQLGRDIRNRKERVWRSVNSYNRGRVTDEGRVESDLISPKRHYLWVLGVCKKRRPGSDGMEKDCVFVHKEQIRFLDRISQFTYVRFLS